MFNGQIFFGLAIGSIELAVAKKSLCSSGAELMSWQAVLHLIEKADGDLDHIDPDDLDKAYKKIEFGRQTAGLPKVQMIIAKGMYKLKYRKESKDDGQTKWEFG